MFVMHPSIWQNCFPYLEAYCTITTPFQNFGDIMQFFNFLTPLLFTRAYLLYVIISWPPSLKIWRHLWTAPFCNESWILEIIINICTVYFSTYFHQKQRALRKTYRFLFSLKSTGPFFSPCPVGIIYYLYFKRAWSRHTMTIIIWDATRVYGNLSRCHLSSRWCVNRLAARTTLVFTIKAKDECVGLTFGVHTIVEFAANWTHQKKCQEITE